MKQLIIEDVYNISSRQTRSFYYTASAVSGKDETESWAVIGYPSGQQDVVLPVQDYPLCPVVNSVLFPHNKWP